MVSTETADLAEAGQSLVLGKLGHEQVKGALSWNEIRPDVRTASASFDHVETVSVDGVMKVLELASGAADRFKKADSSGKRELVEFVCSNCSWGDGELIVGLYEPFTLMLKTLDALQQEDGTMCRVWTKSSDWWR